MTIEPCPIGCWGELLSRPNSSQPLMECQALTGQNNSINSFPFFKIDKRSINELNQDIQNSDQKSWTISLRMVY